MMPEFLQQLRIQAIQWTETDKSYLEIAELLDESLAAGTYALNRIPADRVNRAYLTLAFLNDVGDATRKMSVYPTDWVVKIVGRIPADEPNHCAEPSLSVGRITVYTDKYLRSYFTPTEG
jgi:hypothetical protein